MLKMLKHHNLKVKYIIQINQEPSQPLIKKSIDHHLDKFCAFLMDFLNVKKNLLLASKQPEKKPVQLVQRNKTWL